MKKYILSPINLLLLYLIIVFFPVLFLDRGLFYLDTGYLDHGLIYFVTESIKKGEFPFWNPHIYSGIPLLTVYPAIFYPPVIIFFFVPFYLAFGILTVFHFFIAGLGIYLLCRYWNLKKSSSLIAALMFSLNGYSFEQQFVLSIIFSFVWLPYIFLYTDKLIQQRKLSDFYLLILFCFMQMSTGRLDYFYYTQIFIGLWFLFQFFKNILNKAENIKLLNILIVFIAVLSSVILISVNILPLFDYVKYTERHNQLILKTALFWNLDYLQLLQLIFNNFFGDIYYNNGISRFLGANIDYSAHLPLFYNLYIGIPLFVLLIYSLLNWKKESRILPLFIISMFFLILSFGKDGYIYEIFYNHFPMFNILRYPVKLYFVSIFCLSLIVGLGVDLLRIDDLKKLFKITLSVLFILISFLIVVYLNTNTILDYVHTKKSFNLNNIDFILITITRTILFSVIFSIVIYFAKKKEIKTETFYYILLFLISFDLINNNISNLWTIENSVLNDEPPISKEIKNITKNETSDFRVYASGSDSLENAKYNGLPSLINNYIKKLHYLGYNRGMLFGIKNTSGGYIAPILKNDMLIELITSVKTDKKEFLNLASILGIRFFIVQHNDRTELINKTNFRFINSYYDGFELWEAKNYNPIVSFKPKAFVVKNSENDILGFISQSSKMNIDFNDTVILFNDDTYNKAVSLIKKDSTDKIKKPEIKIISETANTLNISAKAPSSGYLVISNNYFEGWTAYDNGIETPILKANYTFQAIRISSGVHEVKLKYTSKYFKTGLFISLTTLFLLLIPLGLRLFKVKNKVQRDIEVS